jgi:hypothetical protein
MDADIFIWIALELSALLGMALFAVTVLALGSHGPDLDD